LKQNFGGKIAEFKFEHKTTLNFANMQQASEISSDEDLLTPIADKNPCSKETVNARTGNSADSVMTINKEELLSMIEKSKDNKLFEQILMS
jgi:hypothetical protein